MITKAWRIIRFAGHDMILCLVCDRFSFNVNDVREVYCGYCHHFLRDIPMAMTREDDEPVRRR